MIALNLQHTTFAQHSPVEMREKRARKTTLNRNRWHARHRPYWLWERMLFANSISSKPRNGAVKTTQSWMRREWVSRSTKYSIGRRYGAIEMFSCGRLLFAFGVYSCRSSVIGDTNHLSSSYHMLWFKLNRICMANDAMNYARIVDSLAAIVDTSPRDCLPARTIRIYSFSTSIIHLSLRVVDT